jgi:hypothetical protein
MKRFIASVMMLALLSMTLIPAAAPASANSTTYDFTFEKTVKPFEAYRDKAPVDAHTLVLKQEAKGNSYAAMTTTDADAVWMMTTFKGSGNAVKVAFQARNVEGSKNAKPIFYIGTTKPTISDFQVAGNTLNNDWQNYEIMKEMKGDVIIVAIGYVTDKPSWAAFDNISIKLYTDNGVTQLAPADSITYKSDFEKAIDTWLPFTRKFPVNEHSLVLKREPNGNGYAAMTTVGADAVWMLKSFPLGPSPSSYGTDVKVIFEAMNVADTRNVQPMIYLGTSKPTGIEDFVKLGSPLTANWQTYQMEKQVKGTTLVVGIGYLTDKSNWAAFDNVIVKVLGR